MEKDNLRDSLNKNNKETAPLNDTKKVANPINKKLKESLDKLKNFIVKKYKFVDSISILPPESIGVFLEAEEVPKESKDFLHLQIILPDDKLKEVSKIKVDVIKKIQELKEKIWVTLRTPKEIWGLCLDSQFSMVSAIAMSLPLYDSGFLGSLRVAEIHKSLILNKFKEYVVSYVIAGSLVRGEAQETSDVDVFVIINDTDVKQMSPLELKERLKGIIYSYVLEASDIAGVKNKLEPQIYLLTDFWEAVKDAHPVIFTFIRDGIPLYDKGTFLPWKTLLRKGKLKPSPEAIDMFMSLGDKTVKIAKDKLLDIAVQEIYWGAITPSQALLMLYGLPPPNPRETVKQMRQVFMNKEKMLSERYIKILDKIVSIYKDYEHKRIKEIKGSEIDKLILDFQEYLSKLKELKLKIEENAKRKIIKESYSDVVTLLKNILGKYSNEQMLKKFESEFVKKGELSEHTLKILKELIKLKDSVRRKEIPLTDSEKARRYASELISKLTEYSQRKILSSLKDKNMKIVYGKDKKNEAEIFVYDNGVLLFEGGKIKNITSNVKEITNEEAYKIMNSKSKEKVNVSSEQLDLLKKEIGDFEIIL